MTKQKFMLGQLVESDGQIYTITTLKVKGNSIHYRLKGETTVWRAESSINELSKEAKSNMLIESFNDWCEENDTTPDEMIGLIEKAGKGEKETKKNG